MRREIAAGKAGAIWAGKHRVEKPGNAALPHGVVSTRNLVKIQSTKINNYPHLRYNIDIVRTGGRTLTRDQPGVSPAKGGARHEPLRLVQPAQHGAVTLATRDLPSHLHAYPKPRRGCGVFVVELTLRESQRAQWRPAVAQPAAAHLCFHPLRMNQVMPQRE